ncbi:ARM repeat-containing protein [Wolfiporia cocos MD-104 SS10]|uniref:Importin-13 n=1 Tax=Wolfiporia cocos (strain MD-104) TaxID=742152 RepID=A0A2H3JWG9_WOLCO|nr:ARM repeat-containing protein [Wolfiporia cocos MD-104 SS10]
MATTFLPVLAPGDIERAAQLIQQTYGPNNSLSSDNQRRLQQELFDIQKRPEAWGLVVPFLAHADPNVQFFGAHTAQVKIARDWESFPQEHVLQLRDTLLELTGRSIASGRGKVTLRKLFVAIVSLALKICPGNDTDWPDWVLSCVSSMSSMGASNEQILDFLAIAAEEVESADLVSASKAHMRQTLLQVVPSVVQAISACVVYPQAHGSPSQLVSALKCFQAWLLILPANDLTPLIPPLIALLNPGADGEFDESTFSPASDALQEVMAKSALSDGAGTKTLTEPLLLWFEQYGGAIVNHTLNVGFADGVSHSFCKLLVALGDHSTLYLATNIASSTQPAPVPPLPEASQLPSKSQLVQTFLRLLLSYTALPGVYGVDEEESEMTLSFWYLFQEALWNTEYEQDFDYGDAGANVSALEGTSLEQAQWRIAKAVYSELVQVLRRKVMWPNASTLHSWTRDLWDRFQSYRRDVGDTLINAYYILRDDLLQFYVEDTLQRLASKQAHQGWEEVEATLHCIMAIQEAVPIEDNPHLRRVFGSDILGRLPMSGTDRVRRTALLLAGSYASWFTTQSANSTASPLMTAISYVVAALPEPTLCLPAANALRDLCDANRTALAPHISAFGELHAGLTGIPDTEKSKVLQSIASVIQALPPAEAVPPVDVIVSPVVVKLHEALQSTSLPPEEARAIVITQLETVSGVARGLTRTNDSILVLDDPSEVSEESKQLRHARDDPRMASLRERLLAAIKGAVERWCTDAMVSDALSDLIKAITSLPSDITLLSLPPVPLLELICLAAQRQLTAVWLSLATMLAIQLDPPSLIPTIFKAIPSDETRAVVLNVLLILVQTTLNAMSQSGAMESNPDIVQSFFNYMDTVAHHFISTFYALPPELFDALIKCAITALSLQERYSLVAACTFLVSLINRTSAEDELSEAKTMLGKLHGEPVMRAILRGFAGSSPRSATPNLVDLMSALIAKFPAESRSWVMHVLYEDGFADSRATDDAKEKFMKVVFGTRSSKRVRDAAQQFILIARGLEGTTFGYASVTM